MPTARMRDVFACPVYWADREAASSTANSATNDFGGRLLRMEANMKAPDFNLLDENGESVSLKQFRGKNVVLFFYPKANTPG
jgi:peroxiredoxin Q/BCP